MPDIATHDFYTAEDRFYDLYRELAPAAQEGILHQGNGYTFGSVIGMDDYYQGYTNQQGFNSIRVSEAGARLIDALNGPHAAALFKVWLVQHDLWK